MSNVRNKLLAFLREEEGLTTVEYAIAGGLVGLFVIASFQLLGQKVGAIIDAITNLLPSP